MPATCHKFLAGTSSYRHMHVTTAIATDTGHNYVGIIMATALDQQRLTFRPGSTLQHRSGGHLCSHVLAAHLHTGLGVVGCTHVPNRAIVSAVAQQACNEG